MGENTLNPNFDNIGQLVLELVIRAKADHPNLRKDVNALAKLSEKRVVGGQGRPAIYENSVTGAIINYRGYSAFFEKLLQLMDEHPELFTEAELAMLKDLLDDKSL